MKLTCCKPGKGRSSSNFFAVPDEDFSTGMVTGTKLFREMLDAMKTSDASHPRHIQLIMSEMGSALKEKESSKSRRGAAMTVSWLMADALLHFAKNANFKPWLDSKLAEAERSKVFFDEREAKHKAEFVTHMKAAKAKKAAMEVSL